jgi:hypothetical protein
MTSSNPAGAVAREPCLSKRLGEQDIALLTDLGWTVVAPGRGLELANPQRPVAVVMIDTRQ